MTNFDKLKAEIQQMSVDDFAYSIGICSRVDDDIKSKYCTILSDCSRCQKEWLNREAKE